ncbi:hypothetical protein D3C81_2052740 [compost metagenome]
MTYPHLAVMVRQPPGQLQRTLIGFTGKLDMRFIINVLQIKQHEICQFKQIIDFVAFIITVGVKCSMQVPAFFHFGKQLFYKMRLQGWFTAGNGQPATGGAVII